MDGKMQRETSRDIRFAEKLLRSALKWRRQNDDLEKNVEGFKMQNKGPFKCGLLIWRIVEILKTIPFLISKTMV